MSRRRINHQGRKAAPLSISIAHLPYRPGVYGIRCKATNELYVGSTREIFVRARAHVRGLMNGTHNQRRLAAAYERHGPSAFVIEVLEESPVDELGNCERRWMDRLQPTFNNTLRVVRKFYHVEDRIAISDPVVIDLLRREYAHGAGCSVAEAAEILIQEASAARAIARMPIALTA